MAKEQILIRTLNPTTQKIKMVFPSIANNKQLMKNVGFVISDPNYDAKMDAHRNKTPYLENGQAKEAVKESFAPAPAPALTPAPISVPSESTETETENIILPKKKRGRPKNFKQHERT